MSDLEKERVNSVKITVKYETNRSRGENDFNNLQDLKRWLDNNPLIADKLGYKRKS